MIDKPKTKKLNDQEASVLRNIGGGRKIKFGEFFVAESLQRKGLIRITDRGYQITPQGRQAIDDYDGRVEGLIDDQ